MAHKLQGEDTMGAKLSPTVFATSPSRQLRPVFGFSESRQVLQCTSSSLKKCRFDCQAYPLSTWKAQVEKLQRKGDIGEIIMPSLE